MKNFEKICLVIVVFSALCAGLLISGILHSPSEIKMGINQPESKQFIKTMSGGQLNIYAGSIGNITINLTIPNSPASIPVYRGVFLPGDLVNEMPGDFKARTNVTSEQDAPEVGERILEQYGGLPSDAILTGAVTNYEEVVNKSTRQVVERSPLDTSVSWWRMVDGKPIVGDRDSIQIILGENGELIRIYKRWRTYTLVGNASVIPFSQATAKLQNGEVLNPTMGVGEDVFVYSTILGYYAKGLESPEITLEPVWIFYGNTTSGSYLSFQVYARQFANFTATPTAGNAPLNVTFNDASDASPTQWLWDFGDGTNSTARNTTHTYTSAGNYNITLKVWNDLGSDTMVKPYYINVTAPSSTPTINGIAPNTGVNTTTVSITNLSGTNFAAGATVKMNRTGYADIAGTSVTVVSPTKITCSFNLTNKIAGQYNVVINNTNGLAGILANGFTVTVPSTGPTITSITPNTGANTSTVSITNLSGTNFLNGATVMLTPANSRPLHKGRLTDGTGGARLNLPQGVYISGNYAYVASAGSNALEIVNISNPASPVHKGSIINGSGGALLNFPMSVSVAGNYAYVASSDSNALEIVNISNPASPAHKGRLTDGSGGAALDYPMGVYVAGNYAYVASYGSSALEIINVSNPASPTHKGKLTDGTGGAYLYYPTSVFVSGNYAYVTSSADNALEIVDVSNPANPVHKGKITDGTGGALLYYPTSVYVSGNYAYVTSYNDALEIVDVSNPANPVHKGSIIDGAGGALLSSPASVYVSGNYAYIASSGNDALEIVDISNPASPVHKGSITDGTGNALLANPASVYVSGNYAYVASYYSNALEIVNVGTVTATNVTVVSPTKITCSLNLLSRIAGPYNVVLTNPNGEFATLMNGFTITG